MLTSDTHAARPPRAGAPPGILHHVDAPHPEYSRCFAHEERIRRRISGPGVEVMQRRCHREHEECVMPTTRRDELRRACEVARVYRALDRQIGIDWVLLAWGRSPGEPLALRLMAMVATRVIIAA